MKTETIQTSTGPQRVRCYALPYPATCDPWTILFVDEPFSSTDSRRRTCLGLSGHSGGMPGRHLGKRIPFAELPKHLQNRVTTNQ